VKLQVHVVFALALCGGCYGPNLANPGFYCHDGDEPACPDGQMCIAGRCMDRGAAVPDGGAGDSALPPGGADLATPPGADLATPPGPPDLATPPSVCGVRINEVQTAGAAGAADEFVEIVNTCSASRSIDGFKLAYRAASGTTDVDFVTFTGTTLAGGAHYVCGQTAYSGTADVRYAAAGMAAAGGGLALLDASGASVDAVGWGNATNVYVQVAAAPAPGSGQSIQRLPDGHDSGNNASDFTIGASPTPRATNQ
jgi:Lamin Tail Domain